MMSFFSVSCWFVSVSLFSFFLSALLVCLDVGLFWKSLFEGFGVNPKWR